MASHITLKFTEVTSFRTVKRVTSEIKIVGECKKLIWKKLEIFLNNIHRNKVPASHKIHSISVTETSLLM